MLEVFKDLAVRGASKSLDLFIDTLSAHLSSGWSRYLEGERRLKEMTSADDEPQYAFQREAQGDIPAVGLFLIRRMGGFEVTNIVPQESGSLTKTQYNSIIEEFAERGVKPAADALGLSIEMTPDRLPISHWLGDEATRRLRSFSRAANKGTGSSHPMDFKRWAAFLVQAHRDAAALDAGTLQRWLVEEEHWPEEKAVDLAIEYEFGRNLLEAYDAET